MPFYFFAPFSLPRSLHPSTSVLFLPVSVTANFTWIFQILLSYLISRRIWACCHVLGFPESLNSFKKKYCWIVAKASNTSLHYTVQVDKEVSVMTSSTPQSWSSSLDFPKDSGEGFYPKPSQRDALKLGRVGSVGTHQASDPTSSVWNVGSKQLCCCCRSLHGVLPPRLASRGSAAGQVPPNNEVPLSGSTHTLQRRLEPGSSCSLVSCCTTGGWGSCLFPPPPASSLQYALSCGGFAWRVRRELYRCWYACQQILQEQSSACGEPERWRDESWAPPSSTVSH